MKVKIRNCVELAPPFYKHKCLFTYISIYMLYMLNAQFMPYDILYLNSLFHQEKH